MNSLQQLIISHHWALTETYLQAMFEIAGREEGPALEMLRAQNDKPLGVTRTVALRGSTAIVPVVGPLFRRANMMTQLSGATSLEMLAKEFGAAVNDPNVNHVVLHIDSPGGEANGTSEFASQVRDATKIKPITAYVGGTAASGGYWIAAASSRIVVNDTAHLGSIGVLGSASAPDAKTIQIVSSQSPYKRIDPTTESGRARLQMQVDKLAGVFVSQIATYRGVTEAKVLEDFGKGDVLLGADAVAAGMADEVSTLERLLESSATSGSRSMFNVAHSAMEMSMTGASAQGGGANAPTPVITTVAGLIAAFPDLCAQIQAQASSAGATAERTRILDVEAQSLPGHEALIQTLKADGKTTGPEAAVRIIQADRAAGSATLNALKKDGENGAVTQPVTQPPKVEGDAEKMAAEASLPLKERCQKQWDRDGELRAEFGGVFERYHAYMKNKSNSFILGKDSKVGARA